MFKNHFKIAYRNLLKSKLFSAINIMGLAMGMASCMLILQYVYHEKSYDNFHATGDDVYRVRYDYTPRPELTYSYATTYAPVGVRIKEQFPEVLDFCRLVWYEDVSRSEAVVNYHADEVFREKKVFFADSSFFEMFSFPLAKGHQGTALTNPFSAVITESLASKIFNDEDPMGKVITLDGAIALTITGILKPAPGTTHLSFDMLISFSTLSSLVKQQGGELDQHWGWFSFYNYLLLAPGADPRALEKKLPEIVRQFRGEDMVSVDRFLLQSLKDIYLYSDLIGEIKSPGSGEILNALLIITGFILLLAWINYINLHTAQSTERAREVGVRKILGSSQPQLMGQFMAESFLLNTIAFVMALTIFQLFVPWLARLTDTQFSVPLWTHPFYPFGILLLLIVGSLFTGAYPSLLLASFQPIKVIKGQFKGSAHGIRLRKGLVVLQFTASSVLIMATFLILHQIQYMRTQHLGVNMDQILIVKSPTILHAEDTYPSQWTSLKNQLKAQPGVISVSASSFIPGQPIGNQRDNIYRPGDQSQNPTTYDIGYVDFEFLTDYDVTFLAGRNFSPAYRTDSTGLILNERAMEALGFSSPEAAIGQPVKHPELGTFTVIGVIQNYHQESLQHGHHPTLFLLREFPRPYYSFKVNPANLSATLSHISAAYQDAFPGNPFEVFFLDDHFNQQYQSDIRFGSIFILCTTFAIFIACLGLFGLSSFAVRQRTKEIGIRKVLGASVQSVVNLLSRDFIKLICLASIIALPIAYFAIQRWLENYAFRIEISWWLLTIPVVIVLFIAIVTISFQTIKAALANPVESLRYE